MTKIMRKLPTVALIIVLLLSACGTATPEPTTAPTDTPEVEATAPVEGPEAPTSVPPTANPGDPVEVTAPETPGMCQAAPLPELDVREADETDWVKGTPLDEAEMIIYEYSDFQCPGCAGMYPVLESFLELNPGTALVYRHFPLDFHEHAQITSEAAEAAGAQGKFWEMHNILFDNTSEWIPLSADEIRDQLSTYAEEIGLDVEQFNEALEEGTYTEKVQGQYDESRELQLPGTPSFIFDNVLFPSDIGLSLQGLTAFLNIIERQDEIFFPAPPEMTIDEDSEYEAVLTTSKGDIRVNLLPKSAPVHVNNFVFLAQEQWYSGSDFFFVRDDFVAVTGDPTNSTVGYPGYYCQGETESTFDRPGLMGMLANGQFFLTLGADASQLSGQFALIGQVVEGLDVLDELTRRVVGDPSAPAADVVESIQIIQN
ncbi:MAG: peptidylprolyl isomerase [Anaerolineae bacterium]